MKIKIETDRLIIRPFKKSDYRLVAEACNDYEVAKMTLGIPVPYTEQDAKNFIDYTLESIKLGKTYELAIAFKDKPNEVVGCMALVNVSTKANNAELAYWIARKHWGKGIATEGAKAIIDFAFNTLNMHSIYARYFDINPASGRVMEKCGMTYVGIMREHKFRFDKYYNVVHYELLNSDLQKK